MWFFPQNSQSFSGLRYLKHINLKRKFLFLLLLKKKREVSPKLLTSGYIYICTQAIILLLSGVFLTGVIHFCTQRSCIFKCLWWISCSNFELFSRVFNAQTSTKTWVGTRAHKQQLLCHSPVGSHRHLWVHTDTYGFTQTPMGSRLAVHISLALLLFPCPAGAVCQCLTGAGASEQACRVRLSPELQNLPQDLSWSYHSKQLSGLGAQSYVHTGDVDRQNLRSGTNEPPAVNGRLWVY